LPVDAVIRSVGSRPAFAAALSGTTVATSRLLAQPSYEEVMPRNAPASWWA